MAQNSSIYCAHIRAFSVLRRLRALAASSIVRVHTISYLYYVQGTRYSYIVDVYLVYIVGLYLVPCTSYKVRCTRYVQCTLYIVQKVYISYYGGIHTRTSRATMYIISYIYIYVVLYMVHAYDVPCSSTKCTLYKSTYTYIVHHINIYIHIVYDVQYIYIYIYN